MTTHEGYAKITDPSVMRAMAHPARMSIMEQLTSTDRETTATECAELVGLSPSAVSYHLRALAKLGLIEGAPSRGDGRERVWRMPFKGIAVEAPRGSSDDALDAEHSMLKVFLARGQDRLDQWYAQSAAEPQEWFEASVLNETVLLLTADELKALTKQMFGLIDKYKRADRVDAPEDARRVSMQVRTFPILGS